MTSSWTGERMSGNNNVLAELVVDVPADDTVYAAWIREWFTATAVVFDALHVADHVSGGLGSGKQGRAPSGVGLLLTCASERLGGSSKSRKYSAANAEWVIQMAVGGRTATFLVYAADEQGNIRGRDFIKADIWRDDEDKRWSRLSIEVPDEGFRGAHGSEVQTAVRDALRGLAEVSNPVYGEIGYPGSGHCTGLERAMRSWGLFDTYPRARRHLRGYNWVTVIPREILEQLGGIEDLQATGAFAEVLALPSGGAWLQATPDFLDYGDDTSVRRVFLAVARALPPGLPQQVEELGVPAKRTPVVLEDAATYGAHP